MKMFFKLFSVVQHILYTVVFYKDNMKKLEICTLSKR